MNVVLRPFEDRNAGAFANAVNKSLDTLLPWMSWAHENYMPEDTLKWFHYTHLQRQQELADESGTFSANGKLSGVVGIRYSGRRDVKPALGYWVRSSEQRKGIASEAVRMLAAGGFKSQIQKLLKSLWQKTIMPAARWQSAQVPNWSPSASV